MSKNKRTTKWYRKNEAEVIKRLGLKPTRNSGATWIDKADGQNDNYICELKSTDKESFSIKQSVLHKLEVEAIEAHKIPLFAFQFINTDEVWVAVKESDIKAIKGIIQGKEKQNFFDFDIDKEEQSKYNKIVSNRNAGKTFLARQAYQEQRKRENSICHCR